MSKYNCLRCGIELKNNESTLCKRCDGEVEIQCRKMNDNEKECISGHAASFAKQCMEIYRAEQKIMTEELEKELMSKGLPLLRNLVVEFIYNINSLIDRIYDQEKKLKGLEEKLSEINYQIIAIRHCLCEIERIEELMYDFQNKYRDKEGTKNGN
jgi:hypothetical protein